MQQNYASGSSCCFMSDMPPIDPTQADNVIMAGDVVGVGQSGGGCALATIYFPTQVYRAGYRPEEAMRWGTLFPELVSTYPMCRREV